MGYRIKPVSRAKGPQWKLQFISYKKADAANPKAKHPEKIRDIPKSDWLQHGFTFEMSLDQAKERAKSLNAQAEVVRWGETKAKIRERLKEEDTVECAFLPPLIVAQFEKEILFEKLARGTENVKQKNKIESHWRMVKKIIREISLPPKEWNEKAYRFYNLFVNREMSPSYVQKVLRILNEYGYFLARREDKAFLPIPAPRGAEAQRIADAFFEATDSGEGEASDPLTPAMLDSKREAMRPDHYNWLFISIWFGLRPFEIDQLRDPKTWKVTVGKNGRKLLHVYQPKLITVPKPKRWKVIPVKTKEQNRALAMIEAQTFKRPIYKSMHSWFDGVTLYGGRKGFTDLMLERGEKFEEISLWMGHRTLDRTYRDYKDRLKTSYEDAG